MFNTDLKYVHFQDLKNVHVPNLDGTSISFLSQWKFPSTSRFIRIFCYSEIVIMWAVSFMKQYYTIMPPMRDSMMKKVMDFLNFQVF